MLCTSTGLVFLAGSQAALGAPPEIYVGLESRYSDNIGLTADKEQSDIEHRVALYGTYESDPGKCVASADGELAYSVYSQETYDPETEINAGVIGSCKLVRGLSWEAENQIREVTRSSRRSNTPDNRTRKNVFRTGPDYRWRLSSVNFINLSSRYENTQLEDSAAADSERVTGSVAWTHLFSPDLSAGISTFVSMVELDTTAEIQKSVVNATIHKRWSATSFSGSLGVSEIETKLGTFQQKSDAVVGDLTLKRTLDTGGILYLRASRELTDQASDFDIRFDEFSFQQTDSSTLEATSIETGLNKTLSNGDLVTIAAFANRSDYLESTEQEDRTGLRTSYSRRISPRFSAVASGRYEYLTYESDQVDDEVVGVDLGLTYRASRGLTLAAKIGRTERTSDVRSQEYQEDWLLLSIDYRLR